MSFSVREPSGSPASTAVSCVPHFTAVTFASTAASATASSLTSAFTVNMLLPSLSSTASGKATSTSAAAATSPILTSPCHTLTLLMLASVPLRFNVILPNCSGSRLPLVLTLTVSKSRFVAPTEASATEACDTSTPLTDMATGWYSDTVAVQPL